MATLYGSGGSSLNETITTSDWTFTVAVSSEASLWTADPTLLPIYVCVGGERMLVTSISGAASPQTFVVTRSVNGVVKSHEEGAVIELADPVYYGV